MSRIRSTICLPLMIGLLVVGAPGCSKKAVQSGGDMQSSQQGITQQGITKGPDETSGGMTGGRTSEGMTGGEAGGGMTGGGMTGGGTNEGMTGGGNSPSFPDTALSGRDTSSGLRGLDKNPSEERVGNNNAGGNTLMAKADPGSAGRQMEEIRAEQTASAAAGLRDVFFAYDSFAILEEGRQALARDAEWLKANPGAQLKIEGHCDERGTSAYNLVLGEKRAKAVRNYLVELGVGANHLSVVSYGKERPFCREHTEPCYAQNRRGHVVVKAGK